MKCPKCVEQNLKSTLSANGPSMSTLVYYTPYYDEDGVYHKHDANHITSQYVCSNGHKLVITGGNRCPSCDWKIEQEIEVVE